jgi:molecular chaperone DnaK
MVAELKEFIGNENNSAEDIRKKAGEMQQASLKVFEAVYKKGAAAGGAADSKPADEANFEDVDKNKK